MSTPVPALFTETQAVAGGMFLATLSSPPAGLTAQLGARVELPVSRAIVTAWQPCAVTSTLASVTLESPLQSGLYNVVFRTSDAEPPQFETFVPLVVVDASQATTTGVTWPVVDLTAVRPSVDDVALYEESRLVDRNTGEMLDSFSLTTRPTSARVEAIIDEGTDFILAQMRPVFDTSHYRQVKRIITLYVASVIEGSFFKEQQTERGGPQWEQDYKDALMALNNRIEQDYAQNNLVGSMEPGPRPILGDGSTTSILA